MPGQLFTHYFLTDGIEATPEWQSAAAAVAAFRSEIAPAYAPFTDRRQPPNEAATEQELIRPILESLGWADYLPQQGANRNEDIPDYLLFTAAAAKERAAGRSRAEDRYQDAAIVEESKRFGLALDARDEDAGGQARTPHGQILRYLATADIASDSAIRWGILTNGGVWRLYDYRARPRATGYYEADLAKILRSGDDDALRLFLPTVPARVVHAPSGSDRHVPGGCPGRGATLRGAGCPGPVRRGLRSCLPRPGRGVGRRDACGSRTGGRAPGGPDLPLPPALRTLRRGPGPASRQRRALRRLRLAEAGARAHCSHHVARRRLLDRSSPLLQPPAHSLAAD